MSDNGNKDDGDDRNNENPNRDGNGNHDDNGNGNDNDNDNDNDRDQVGYGNPPRAHQFKKGQSGNPKGRPKKKRQQVMGPENNWDGFKSVREELAREIPIKEGGKTIKLPSGRAALRALFLKALKGDRLAQKEVINLVLKLDQELAKRIAESRATIEERRALQEFRRAPGFPNGIDAMDMNIDPETGEIVINGPRSVEERQEWEERLAERDRLEQEIFQAFHELPQSQDETQREAIYERVERLQLAFDTINDNLPKRYRTKLRMRSHRQGASKPGDQKTIYWPGEDL